MASDPPRSVGGRWPAGKPQPAPCPPDPVGRGRVSRSPGGAVVRSAGGGPLLLGLLLLGLTMAVACGAARSPAAAPTTTAEATGTTTVPTTAPTRVVAVTTTTVAPPPSAPQASPAAAAAALIAAWEKGSRSAARTVATSAAVATLFRVAYAGQTLNDRGCSSAFQIVCSWGPYAGASPSEALYELSVKAEGSSWYVSSVVVES